MKKSLHTLIAGLLVSSAMLAQPTGTATVTGPSSSQSPYIVPSINNMTITSIITATDAVGGYSMCGTPDGLGAFDNGDGTFTLLMNHEFVNGTGGTRAHGGNGAFVSKWVINKTTKAVVSGADLIQTVNLYNGGTYSVAPAYSFTRFCSADLPPVKAFYDAATSLGTQNRIFMNGEEGGNEGKAMAHVVTGPAAGNSYELPYLGRASWENAVACPFTGTKTVVGLMDDTSPSGQVYMYIGTKTNSGLDIDKAGLTNGKLYGVAVANLVTETNTSVPVANTTFSLIDLGQVNAITGTSLNTLSNNLGVTGFLRPEDGSWDPSNPGDFYFATTNAFGSNSRLWRLRFTNLATPELGGTITAVLDGSEGQQMFDNIAIANKNALIVEDVGANAHVGKMWNYNIMTDVSTIIAQHDPNRFVTGAPNFLTIDEEASGQIDMEAIFGTGYFLFSDQAHYTVAGPTVEGGQLLLMFNPMAAPEINIQGNAIDIADGSIATSPSNFTDFGISNVGQAVSKTFVIQNTGYTNLVITSASLTGANASDFSLAAVPATPFTVTAGGQQTISIQFNPAAVGSRSATVNFGNNDVTEPTYDYAVSGTGTTVSTGIAANTKNVAFYTVYPNPAKDEAIVNMNFDKNENITINVIDIQGKKVIAPIVKTFEKGEHTVTLNTSVLSNGTYYVQIIKNGKPSTTKLVVNH